MEQPFPKYALFNGKLHTFVKRVEPIPGAKRQAIVICSCAANSDEASDERYVEEPAWLEAAREFKQTAQKAGLVTSQSSAQEKITLFRSLFRGRPDVHAHGFRRKDGGIGYVPACANEWKRDTCPRAESPKAKCSLCSKQAFLPLTDSAIVRHFKGTDDRLRDVIGLYVLRDDSTTSVLVMDFDKNGWQDAVSAIRTVAKSRGLQASVERSRSGNGGHIWFFFERPISAKLARDFGSALITEAMRRTKTVKFDAYDRMFPAQTTIPEGGFGNLISLPFQGKAQREGNSVFVDEQFHPYPDQWLFLSHVEKIDEQAAQNAIDSLAANALGDLAEQHPVPWRHQLREPISQDSFSEPVDIVESDMIYVPESALNAKAADAVRRLAAFANPEFYRAQAMHQSVYGKHRVIFLGETREGHTALPRGCKQRLFELLDEVGVRYSYRDERYAGRNISAQFSGILRPEQEHAANQLLKHDNGILSAPTGFGKTVIGAFVIAHLQLSTLVIVPKTALISQWATRLSEFLDIQHPDGPPLTQSGKPSKRKRLVIGQIGGGKNRISEIVDVATFQSLVEKDPDTGAPRVKDMARNYGLIICDECHHAAASHLEMILKATPAKYVYGLSATPKRSDGLDRALFMLCGPIRYVVDPKEQAAQQGIQRVLHPVFTRIRIPNYKQSASYNQILEKLCTDETRNRLIAENVAEAARCGRVSLVLTKRKEHARQLAKLISQSGCKTHLLVGEGTAAQRRKLLEEATKDDAEEPFAIIATESYIGEGFDFSRLDTLFLATPISWSGNVTQQAGRLHRTHKGKAQVTIWDYVDSSIPMLERMYKKRLKTYAKLGYEVEAGEANDSKHARFIVASEAMKTLAEDIRSASSSIEIAAPYASPKAARLLQKPTLAASASHVRLQKSQLEKPPTHS